MYTCTLDLSEAHNNYLSIYLYVHVCVHEKNLLLRNIDDAEVFVHVGGGP